MRAFGTLIAGMAAAMLLLSAAPASAAVDCNKYPCDPSCQGFCSAVCVSTCFLDGDGSVAGNGTPNVWLTSPIKYKVNIDALVTGQGLDKTKVLAAIDAAFKTWELPCSTIKFQYAGETTSAVAENDYILIYFKNDPADSTLYFLDTGMKLHPTDSKDMVMLYGLMQLNATPNHPQYSFDWTTDGAVANKFDIQTVVTYFLPPMLGFQVGRNTGAQSFQVAYAYNYSKHDLCQAHKDIGTYVYFDSANTTCTKPSGFVDCASAPPPGDGGTTVGDGGVNPGQEGGVNPGYEGGVNPGYEGGVNPGYEAGISGEGTIPPAEDDGCCRVSHGETTSSVPFLSLLGFALLLLIGARRRG